MRANSSKSVGGGCISENIIKMADSKIHEIKGKLIEYLRYEKSATSKSSVGLFRRFLM